MTDSTIKINLNCYPHYPNWCCHPERSEASGFYTVTHETNRFFAALRNDSIFRVRGFAKTVSFSGPDF